MTGPEKTAPNERAWGLLAVLLTLLVYLPAVGFPFVNWDDTEYVELNLAIRHLDPHSILGLFQVPHGGFWIPLTWLSLAFDFGVGRLEPWVYHLDNILLHLFNTYLVFIIVRRLLNLSGTWTEPPKVAAAFLTSLLFGIHPLHVESVVWVSERKDVLYGLFWLLSLDRYLAYVKEPKTQDYILSLLFFALSLLAKPMALSLPLVLLYMDHWPLGRFSRAPGRVLMEKFPFLACAATAGLMTLHSQAQAGALWGLGVLSAPQRLMNACHSIVFYLEKAIVPLHLAAFYPLLPEELFNGYHWFAVLLCLTITGVTLAFKERQPHLWAVWAYFLLTLFPALGLFQTGNQAAADRFTYLPSLGPFLLFALSAAWGLSHWRKALLPMITAVLLLLGVVTLGQEGSWRDSTTLWENTLKWYPRNNLVVHFNLGRAYEVAGRYDDAARKYEDALAANPDFFYPLWGKGRIRALQGDLPGSVEDYRKAIYLVPQHPALHAELGLVLQRMGKEKEALEELRRALRLDPHFGDGYQALGIFYRRKDRWEGAMACFETAWFLDPDNPAYFKDAMEAYRRAGRPRKALEGYRKLAADPRSPLRSGL